ncbi:replication initiation factor domain-containing protein [Yersinia similis]|uniref:replication initiation factor domain-containing protein n=1 Tax=Yersinia similis TaxID=367190 RepID=UPI0011A0E4C3|nr:replication initiation factor domain-containing protein [Yersinia similis]
MKVSPKRIDDGSKSIFVGTSEEGHQLKLRCDYLSIVSDTHSLSEKQFLSERCRAMRAHDSQYRIVPHFSNRQSGKKSRYHEAVTIKEKYPDAPVLLWIGYGAVNKGAGDIRFDFRPQHLSNVGLNKLLLWLADEHRLGPLLFTLLERAWITRVDAALDVYEFYLNDAYVSLKGSYKAEKRGFPDGGREVCLGSRTSQLYIACYPKIDGLGKQLPEPDTNGLVTINTAQLACFTRFEARLHMKQKHQLKLKNLQGIANLFEGLEFYDRSLDADLVKYPEFAAMLRQWPLPQAKSEFKKMVGKNELQRFERRCLHRHIRSSLIDTPAVWEHWYLCIHNLGLLGQPGYWVPRHRERRENRGLSLLGI